MTNSPVADLARVPDDGTRAPRTHWWDPVMACVVWLALWHLTPGLLAEGVGSWFSENLDVAVLIESAVAAAVVTALLLTHRRHNRVLFARSRLIWAYAVPAALAVALPFHYGLEAPVAVYIVWMTVSVFWQNYLTFGLLQDYVGRHLPTWATVAVVAGMFWLGHAIVLPDAFAPASPVPSLGIIALGALFAFLRTRFGTLHLLLVLHLSFYFVFA